MTSANVYPANKNHFIKLKKFCSKILGILSELDITPIAYGSLAYFYYTKDKKIPVNDIDLLISENSFNKIIKVLKHNKIKHKYSAKWHTLQIFEGDLKIELDSVNFWQKNLPKDMK